MGGVSTRDSTYYPPRDTGGFLVITVRLQCRKYGPMRKGELASSWNSLLAELLYEMAVTSDAFPSRWGDCWGDALD